MFRAPYVLVAGSGGGHISSSFARLHRQEIAGMVFLDVPAPYPNPPPELVEELRCDNPSNIERRDYLQVENDAWDLVSRSETSRSRSSRSTTATTLRTPER